MKLKGQYLSFLLVLVITATIKLCDASRDNTIIKTIKSEDGDVIDCVDINHQPAFDHPSLKGHIIKRKPSNHPSGVLPKSIDDKKKEITQLWQLSGECPEGTIPIRRISEEQRNAAKRPHHKTPPTVSNSDGKPAVNQLRHEYAYTYTPTGSYYGARATISAWQPFVERRNEFSLSQIWLVAGSGVNLNTIEAGWTVDPAVFGDYRTRLFVYWTRDGYQRTGCYNLRCSGFVQITNRMVIGGAVVTTGVQPEVTILIWKDVRQSVWWLQYNGVIVGYWPNSIFTLLKGTASLVEWGGEIINSNVNGIHTATDMGSGRFAQAGFRFASYFRNLLVVNNKNTLVFPPSIGSATTNSNCYNIAVGKSVNWGYYFYYGGPGRNLNCP
ncbi:OLC1v1001739C3 [Oldenlandia corymbosa var. corymbosa]|uniref:OLC1v1001739C3 n=1 Tax=Oldenlandia corymbosa var. corymbosa TaxID=529605 RepID=A0AAV1D7L3_OLDCO|nr:OLC1v1001739C3 [Oldenlandia corymbosa var. corymbosa]